jgi:hypothetical protein
MRRVGYQASAGRRCSSAVAHPPARQAISPTYRPMRSALRYCGVGLRPRAYRARGRHSSPLRTVSTPTLVPGRVCSCR